MTATQKQLDEAPIRAIAFACLGQIAPGADLESLDPDANLRETLALDSFDFLNLILALDDELAIAVPDADYDKLDTLDNMVAYLAQSVR